MTPPRDRDEGRGAEMRRLEEKIDGVEESLKNQISGVTTAVARIEGLIERKYVTQDQFKPVQAIAFGFVILLCVAVVTAVVSMVIQNPNNARTNTQMVKP